MIELAIATRRPIAELRDLDDVELATLVDVLGQGRGRRHG